MIEKYCGKCQKTKEVDEFSKNPTKKDGLNNSCKECQAAYQKVWYAKNRARHMRMAKARTDRVSEENRQMVYEYLKTHPCVDCGEGDPVVLDFDHVRGEKEGTISYWVSSGFPQKKILLEMEKCDIRCANCHRRKTAKQFGWSILSRIEEDSRLVTQSD